MDINIFSAPARRIVLTSCISLLLGFCASGAEPVTITSLGKQVEALEIVKSDPETSDAEIKKLIPPLLSAKLKQFSDLLQSAIRQAQNASPEGRDAAVRVFTADLKRAVAEEIDLALEAKQTDDLQKYLDQQSALAGPAAPGVPDIDKFRKAIKTHKFIDHDARLPDTFLEVNGIQLATALQQYSTLACEEIAGLNLLAREPKPVAKDVLDTMLARKKELMQGVNGGRCVK